MGIPQPHSRLSLIGDEFVLEGSNGKAFSRPAPLPSGAILVYVAFIWLLLKFWGIEVLLVFFQGICLNFGALWTCTGKRNRTQAKLNTL